MHSATDERHLSAFVSKIEKAGLSPIVAYTFAHYYRKYGIQTIPEYLYYLFDIKTWKVNAVLNFIAYTFFT